MKQYALMLGFGVLGGFIAIAIANRVPNLPLVDPGARPAPAPAQART